MACPRAPGRLPITVQNVYESGGCGALARLIEAEMDRGVFVSRAESESTTLGEALSRYLREITPRKKGERQERNRINVWLEHPLASRMLAAVRGSDLATYRDNQRKAGKSDATIRLNLAIISHLFEVARREWGMESLANPCRNITMPSGSKRRRKAIIKVAIRTCVIS